MNTIKPFLLVIFVSLIVQFNGMIPIKPYMIQVFKAFRIPMDPNWASVSFALQILF